MTRFIGMIIFFALSACTQQTDRQKVNLQTEEQAVRALSKHWAELFRNIDPTGEASLFLENGVVYREKQEPVVGQKAIRDLFDSDHKEQNPKQISNWITDRVEVSESGELAIEYGDWSYTGGDISGTKEDHGKYISVYKKVNGKWKISTDMSLSTKPEESLKKVGI